MTETEIKSEFTRLPLAAQVELLQDLWETISGDVAAIPFTASDVRELDRRWAEHVADPSAAVSWSDLRDRLRGSRSDSAA